MSRDNNTEDRSQSTNIELAKRSITNTQTFLDTCVLDADYKTLEEHLVNNPVQQSHLDRCLLRGLQIVQQKERELSHVAPALTILLQSGAKWNSDDLLDDQKTPYHIICESPGDHHELLDLMIKSSQQKIIDTQYSRRCNAVLSAVQNANVNCLKCLIANNADINTENEKYEQDIIWTRHVPIKSRALMGVISNMRRFVKYGSVNEDIFDFLLDKSPIESYTPLIKFAIACRSVYCIKKLIEKGARLDDFYCVKCYLWSGIARLGNVELLKCMLNHGIDKDITDQNGWCLLWYVVHSGNVEAVRYLLDLGVVIPPCSEVLETQCDQCKDNTLIIGNVTWKDHANGDPCLTAICHNNLEIVKLLEEYGSQCCKSFNALRCAVISGSVNVTSYLLNNYKYPLNIEYSKESDPSRSMYTLLTEYRIKLRKFTAQITKLLLDHGADPAKQMCSKTSVNAVMSAIVDGNLDVIAQYIHSGVDVNLRSYDFLYKKLLPFEASVLHGHHDIAKVLLFLWSFQLEEKPKVQEQTHS